MEPDKSKDELPKRRTEQDERPPGSMREGRSSEDEREDEGWGQPESSAQKGTEKFEE